MSFNYTVEKPSGATYGFSLNANSYYESTNKGVNSSYAMAKLNFTTDGSYKLYLDCINYAETNYDFGILSELDKTLQMSATVDSTNVKKNFKGSSRPSVQTVDYGQIVKGSHYIYIKFRKDSAASSNYDSLKFKVRTEQIMPVLGSPTISLNGDILTITPVANATSYKVFSNNNLLTTSTTTTVDLSTLFSEIGTYTITVTALASGYLESGSSNAVTYKLQLITLDLTTLNLSQGTHTIKVKAKAEGYGDSAFSNEVSYTVLPQLEAPTISLNGNLLSSSTVPHATSYAIYSNNTLLTTITTTSVDLSTLITAAGTYTIYAIAKATGYVDSEKSNEVSYTVAEQGYSVSCSQFETEAGYEYQYSTDNGSTWNNITSTGLIVSATQIKLRIHNMYPSGTPSVTKKQIKSTLLGLNISMTTESTDIESENFTLTEDINDIQCFSALGYDVTITVQTEVGMETGVAVKFNDAPTDSTDYDYHTDFGGGDNSDLYNSQDELVETPKIVSDVRKMYIMAYNANENLRIILNGESMSLTNNEIHEYDITQNTTLVLIKLWD